MLTLLKARKITNQAVVRAGKLNVNVSVAVCDTTGSAYPVEPDGRIGGLGRRTGALWEKWSAAAITGRPSDRLFDQFEKSGARLSACSNVVPLGANVVVFRSLKAASSKVVAASAGRQRQNRAKIAQGPALKRSTPPELNQRLQSMLTGFCLPSPWQFQPEDFHDL